MARAGQSVRYASGRVVAAMSAAYVGEGKTDAKDAYVIAETARLRGDLAVIDADTDLVRNLAVLTAHRTDLIADRVRMINRLRDLMTSVFPSLERAFDYFHRTRAPWCCSPATPAPTGSAASAGHVWPPGYGIGRSEPQCPEPLGRGRGTQSFPADVAMSSGGRAPRLHPSSHCLQWSKSLHRRGC